MSEGGGFISDMVHTHTGDFDQSLGQRVEQLMAAALDHDVGICDGAFVRLRQNDKITP